MIYLPYVRVITGQYTQVRLLHNAEVASGRQAANCYAELSRSITCTTSPSSYEFSFTKWTCLDILL
jgi:hypothetical protein